MRKIPEGDGAAMSRAAELTETFGCALEAFPQEHRQKALDVSCATLCRLVILHSTFAELSFNFILQHLVAAAAERGLHVEFVDEDEGDAPSQARH